MPEHQPEKLDLIADAAMLLGPTLSPPGDAAPPADADLVQALARVATALVGRRSMKTPRLFGLLQRLLRWPRDHPVTVRLGRT